MGGSARGGSGRRTRGGGAGWQGDRGRVRVWREDRGIDRITGFRSRTERDGRRQRREGEREEGRRDSGSGRLSAFARLKEDDTLNPTIK